MKPKYPIFIISKGRHDVCYTADMFLKYGVDFKIVIEPQEFNLYKQKYDEKILLQTPFSNLGLGSIPARNFVWEQGIKSGMERHWIFDDNIRKTRYIWNGRKVECDPNVAISEVEKFTDRYENIAISGMQYTFFITKGHKKPFYLNNRVYSNLLIRNDLDFRWRGRYNEDTDLCLQAWSKNWCTVLFNVFTIDKNATMAMKGGNMTELYKENGRLQMSKDLERMWPYVVETKRKFGRAQHHIKKNSVQFDIPLIRRKDINWDKIEKEKTTLKIKEVENIKSDKLKKLVENHNDKKQ